MLGIALLSGLVLGIALVKWREIRGYFKSKQLVRMDKTVAPPPSRILKPFTQAAKRKPRVNDDQRAYLAEQSERR